MHTSVAAGATVVAHADQEFGALDLAKIGDPFAEAFERFVFVFLQNAILSQCGSIVKDGIRSQESGRIEVAKQECAIAVLNDPERFDHLLITILLISGRGRLRRCSCKLPEPLRYSK